MLLDPKSLVPIEETVGSDPTKSTYLSSKYNESSLVLPSTEDNSDSLIKTEEFLEFVDDLSQEPSPLSDRQGTSNQDTVPSVKAEENSHSLMLSTKLLRVLIAQMKAKIFLLLKCQKVMMLMSPGENSIILLHRLHVYFSCL